MSYEIVYNRQFLRAGEKIIPMVLIGSNNTTEIHYLSGRERRCRDWNSLMNRNNTIPLMTADEIIKKAESWTGGKYQQHFMWRSKWVDDKALLSFIKNGIKGAVSLEKLKELSLNPHEVYVRCHLSVWFKDEEGRGQNTIELLREIHTTDELLAYMDEASERLANRKSNESSIYVCVEYPYDKAVQYPKNPPTRRNSPERLESDFWVVSMKLRGHTYFVSGLHKHLKYTYSPTHAKQFKSQIIAEKWINDQNLKSRFKDIDYFKCQYVA